MQIEPAIVLVRIDNQLEITRDRRRPVQAWGRIAESHGANASPKRLMPRVRSDLTRSVFSTILRIYRIGNLHGVTICRELRHSDQIVESEHVVTDRPPAPPVSQAFVKSPVGNYARPPPACPGMGEGRRVARCERFAEASNAAREIRSDPQRLLDDTPHLPNRKLTRCHDLP